MLTKNAVINQNVTASLSLADGNDYDPQTLAMLQAFYSRSTKSITDRVDGMNSEAVRKSLHKYYVGYGHKSIGQCANFVMFIEDVSIFAAKAIQHHPLYNGQETSTRYYDFSERPIVLPVQDDLYESYMRALYVKLLAHAYEAYMRIGADIGPMDDVMERTCRAKAFDLARSVLTAGYTTKLSWSSNFEQSEEQLGYLINSPVPELNRIGLALADMIHEKYPQASNVAESLMDDWKRDVLAKTFFDNTNELCQISHLNDPDGMLDRLKFSYGYRREIFWTDDAIDILQSRKRGQNLPRSFQQYGTFKFNFNIDYGSYRDLHRHRNGQVYFPSYDSKALSMHPWYLQEMMSIGIMQKEGVNGRNLLDSVNHVYSHLMPYVRENVLGIAPGARETQADRAKLMYYVPMGTMVRAHMRYDLPQAIYVAELRSARTVHATARIAARSMARAIETVLPPNAKLFVDDFEGLSRKRGEQTILERK